MPPVMPTPHARIAAAVLAFSLVLSGAGCGDDGPAPPADAVSTPDAEEPTPPPPPGAFELPGLRDWAPAPRLGWPVESVHITSSFGWRVDPVSGVGVRLHRGLDFRGAIGDLVLTIGGGTVDFVGHDPLLGRMVIVDHGDGLTSTYGHLSDVLVAAQMPVERGAAIGLVGNTGRSAAPHLHLTVKLDGVAIDPLEVIGEPRYRPEAIAAPMPPPIVDPPAEPASGTTAATAQSDTDDGESAPTDGSGPSGRSAPPDKP